MPREIASEVLLYKSYRFNFFFRTKGVVFETVQEVKKTASQPPYIPWPYLEQQSVTAWCGTPIRGSRARYK
jgi:hypothetical protein